MCPNCTSPVNGHPENGCVLQALIGVIRDRGNLSERKILDLHANAWVDSLWDDMGPIIDDLEEGQYSHKEAA